MEDQAPNKSKGLGTWSVALGIAGGILGGLGLGEGLQLGKMPRARLLRQAMSELYGARQAARLIVRVERRYWDLFAERTRYPQRALRDHLEQNILPGLALYQTLNADAGSKQRALEEVRAILGRAYGSRARRPVALLDRMPFAYALFRPVVHWMMKWNYPPEGWNIEWTQDDKVGVAFNITSCFYLDQFDSYRVPELTAIYCDLDDRMYDPPLEFVRWDRTKTLGRGDDCCDFRWTRTR